MKSQLFKKLDPQSEHSVSFKRDLCTMLSLCEENLKKIIDFMPHLLTAEYSFTKRIKLEEFSKEINVDPDVIDDSFNVLLFFLQNMMNDYIKNDSAIMWAEDLIEANVIPENHRSKFISIIEFLESDSFEDIKRAYQERISKAGVLPIFQKIGTTVDLRAVLDKEYSWENSVEDYSPKVIGWVPIVSVNIATDSKTNSELLFQGSIEDINIIIKELSAALKVAETISLR